jgi:serine protease AprX
VRNFTRYILILLIFTTPSTALNKYWIFFKDKGKIQNLSFHKQQEIIDTYVTNNAKKRRTQRGLPEFNKTALFPDLPVYDSYIAELKKIGFKHHATSRWLNAVSGTASTDVLEIIRNLPFVESIRPVKGWRFKKIFEELSTSQLPFISQPLDTFDLDYGRSALQIRFHNIDQLHLKGLNGDSVIIAVFDTGFRRDIPALAHIDSHLIAEYDFIQMDDNTSNQESDASSQDRHGTNTLAVLAGQLPGQLVGPAFGARFLLAKTEDIRSETHIEEDNWAMAAEWAEALGVDIVTSSLGYSEFDPGEADYKYQDMDGKTTIVTRAANELARRGVLVVNSAGNEGSYSWYYITAPADGSYVLAAGALDDQNNITDFSSRGPTYDGRIKPDLSALGERVYTTYPDGSFGYNSGTSFSAPLIAGIAALILQYRPTLNLLQLLDIMKSSGDQSQYPNNTRGWGKIDALKALTLASGSPYEKPTRINLPPPQPNPYCSGNGVIFFQVDLSEASQVNIDIYNILGQRIKNITYHGTATHNLIPWNVRNYNGLPVSAGIYIYRIYTRDWEGFGKLTVLTR